MVLSAFWLNNLHFALEFFGGVVFVVLTWLALEGFLIRKDLKTFTKSAGFALVAVWLIAHSLNITSDLAVSIAVVCYLVGLALILLNLYLEMPPALSKSSPIVFVVPAVVSFLWVFHTLATILLALIAVLSFKRYRDEFQKSLLPFCAAFSLLAAASVLAVFDSQSTAQGVSWIVEHVLELVAYGLLGYWGWQYLKLRIKEEMLLIFVGMSLTISVIVTFTFSAILLKNMEREAELNLVSNTKVLDYTLSGLENETLADSKLFAENAGIQNALVKKDFSTLDKITADMLEERHLDFLLVADSDGQVILRAHAATSNGDSITGEKAGGKALGGDSSAAIETTASEGLSVRGAAPVYGAGGKIAGVVISGFIIDNAFLDKLKKKTGLEASVYWGDTLAATTIFGADDKTRSIGTKETNAAVTATVLGKGEGMTDRVTIFSRPYLASYLPLKDADGEIVGMIQASRLQTELAATASTTNRLTLLITLVITLVLLVPTYWLTKRIAVQNLIV